MACMILFWCSQVIKLFKMASTDLINYCHKDIEKELFFIQTVNTLHDTIEHR